MNINYEDGDNIIIVYPTFTSSGKCIVLERHGTLISKEDGLYFKSLTTVEHTYEYCTIKYGFLDLREKTELRLHEEILSDVEMRTEPRLLNSFRAIVDCEFYPISYSESADIYAKFLLNKYKYDCVVSDMNKEQLFDYVLKADHCRNMSLMNAVKRRKVELDNED